MQTQNVVAGQPANPTLQKTNAVEPVKIVEANTPGTPAGKRRRRGQAQKGSFAVAARAADLPATPAVGPPGVKGNDVGEIGIDKKDI